MIRIWCLKFTGMKNVVYYKCFFSCFYHGCKKCFPSNDMIIVNNQTAGHVRSRNLIREKNLEKIGLEQGFELKIEWEWYVIMNSF
jgi:hypothetical protein